MSVAYYSRDYEIVDYQGYVLPEITDHKLRGPKPRSLAKDHYFVCIGAAQTFGCFCEQPYPALLANALKMEALNFGIGGAGPARFLEPEKLKLINNARFAIVQVMSGRSADNSLLQIGGKCHIKQGEDNLVHVKELYRQWLAEYTASNGQTPNLPQLVAETRANWVEDYKRLLNAIKVPTILFWFSKRIPEYQESYSSVVKLFAKFPQLVNQDMMTQIIPHADAYVECVTSRGSPQLLISRFTHKPIPKETRTTGTAILDNDVYNRYYPSPEMYVDAANELLSTCSRYCCFQ